MKRRPEARDGEDAEPPPSFDIFAGLPREPLTSNPASPSPQSDESLPTPPGKSAEGSASIHLEKPPLNRLLEKHPRLLFYVGIAIAALLIGVAIGIKLSGTR